MVKSQVIYKDYSKDAERTALISGENLAHMFGKIARWYTDISWVGHKHVVTDITDFPLLGTAASKDVPASGDAGNNEVVMGNDSRLTDARTPTSHTHSVSEITDFPTLGTAAGYDVPSSGDASNNEVVLGNDSRLTDARTPLSHTHTEADITNLGTYAGASIKGGAATSANKLNIGNSDIGNSTTPVYFDSETGLPIALEYTIEKSVPADAVFTDTTYSTMGPSGSSHAGGLVPDTPSTAGTSKYLREDGTWEVPPNSEYVHPSHTPYSSGLYKITVDALGHVSAASAVTGTDLPLHSHTVSDITNFPTLGTAAGYDVPATGNADDDEVVLGNDSRLSDARTPLSHTHTEADISDLGTYAGSSTKGGAATSANKLNIGASDIGSETKPVYFNATTGKPVACAYSLNASVPANAVFTDINVKQSPSTANESREVLFAGNTGNTETTGTVGKSNKLYFNPSTGALTATSFSGSVDASNLTGSIDATRLPNSGVTANSYGPAAGGTLTYGGTFDVPYVTVDKYGRLTAASTKTFTMPAQYAHPTYTSKTSGLYKITVDNLGHISATAAVTGTDLPVHSHTLNMATSTGSSSITLLANTKYQLTAGGNTYIFTTPTDTVYTHPTYTAKTNGLYKITVDELGHVSATAAVTASDLPSHTHPYLPDTTKYAGSSSVGGAATSANKLNIGSSNIGNSTTPVYFDSTTGLPVALNYTIEKSVPADAKFTDTVYTHPTYTAKASGLYKITVDELGHVSAASAVTGTDLPSHSHNLNIASSTGTSQISLSANAKYQLTAGGSTYIFTTPADNNTTYTVATGDSNGQIKITPSVGDAYNVSVKGLGSAAYTNSSAYATSGHTHTLNIAASSGTSQISLSPNTKYQLTAGGSTYIFTTPPAATMTYSISTGDNNGQIKVTPSSGDAYNVSVKGLGSAAYTASSAYAAASHTHDSIQLSNIFTLSSEGWYRIFELNDTNENSVKGALDNSCEITFKRYYNHTNNEHHEITLLSVFGNMSFVNEVSKSNSKIITWIRYVYTSNHAYIDIYYNTSAPNQIITMITKNYGGTSWKNMSTITTVPTTTEGETIAASYQFSDNVNAASSGHTHSNYLGAKYANGFYGMASPSTDDTVWIRTTSLGLIPYQSGGAGSGHQSLGTSSWYFSAAYIDTVYGSLSGNAASATKLNTNAGGAITPVYFSGGKPVACNVIGSSGGYFNNVAKIESDGVMEIGKYIDMHISTNSANDYDYRITATSTSGIEFGSRNGNNSMKLYSPSGYNQIRFHTAETDKAYNATGITVYPLTVSGSVMVIESGGNMIIGAGESPSAVYTNDFLNAKTVEHEYMFVTADEGVVLISGADTFSNAKSAIFDSSGAFRPTSVDTLSVGRSDCYWNKAYITQTTGGRGGGWISARDNATVKSICVPASSSYCPVVSVKTNNGEWSIGSLGSTSKNTENLYFSYTTDANYSAGSNTASTYYISASGWFSGTAAKADKWTSAKTLTIGSTGKSVDGSGNVSWTLSEIGAAAASHSHSYIPLSGSSSITGELSVTTDNCFRANNGGYGVIFRNDGYHFYFLLTDKKTDGSEKSGNNWNSLRPLFFDLSSGRVYMQNGLSVTNGGIIATAITISNSNYGPLEIVRTGNKYTAGIKFYNQASGSSTNIYLGSIGMEGEPNGGLVRYHTDESTKYTILDTSNLSVSRSLTSGTKIATITIAGTATDLYCQTNTNTTYTFATGDSNGQIKVTPSGGSAQNVSVKGLGSAAYTASTDYAAASHSHNLITRNSDITYGASRLQWFDLSGTGTVSATTPYNPSNDWYHHIMLNHGNGNGYYVDLAICFHSDTFCYKRIVYGSIANADRNDGWVRIIDSSCIGSQSVASAAKWTTARTLSLTGSVTGSASIDGSGNISLATTTNHTHSYLPLAGGTMTGDITFTAVTSTSYPATSCKLYWTGSTDWAKIYYSVTAADAGKLVFDIGDDTNTQIAFAYNGTIKSYINTNGAFSGSAAKWTTARTLTIGSTGKSVDGSGNVSWSLSEIGAAASSHTHSYIPLSGSTAITGELASSSANAFRVYCGGYGAFFRNDGSYVYLLFTDKKTDGSEKTANWNSLRPFYCQLSSGYITMENGLSVKSGLTASAITTTGYLKLGYTNDSTIPTTGIYVNDIRSVNVPASGIGGHLVNFYFHMADSPDTSRWWSIMHVKGWEGAYCAWELAGTAHNTDDRTRPLYVRCSNTNTAWGSWRKIYDTSNKPTLSELGAAAASHTHTYIESKANYTFTSSTLPNSFDWGVSAGFVNSNSGFGSYGSVLTVRTYSGGGGTLQLYAPYSPTYGGTHLKARFGNYDSSSGNSWTSLRELAWNDDKLGANSDGSYWGMSAPNNDSSVWIRTTSLGIIPYQSGGAGSGHCGLGTSTWYFSYAYIDNIYGTLHGTAEQCANAYCYDFGDSSYTSFSSYGVVFAADPTISEVNSLRKRNDFRINYWLGAAGSEGELELVIGNAVDSSTSGNCTGYVTLYNKNGKWSAINPSPYASSNCSLYLPGESGTIPIIGKSQYYGCMAAGTDFDTITSHATMAQSKQSWCGSYVCNGTWNNMISVRHRNGVSDGSSYGFYIRNVLTGASNLVYNQQYSGSWRGEVTLLDSSNYTDYTMSKTAVVRSYVIFSGSTAITSGKEKTSITLDTLMDFSGLGQTSWLEIHFQYSGSPSGRAVITVPSYHGAWVSGVFATSPGGGAPGTYNACKAIGVYYDYTNSKMWFNTDAALTIYRVTICTSGTSQW